MSDSDALGDTPGRRPDRHWSCHIPLETYPGAAAALDTDGVIVAANASWRHMLADPADGPPLAAVGANFLSVCCGEDGDTATGWRFASAVRAILRGERPETSAIWPSTPSGWTRWFQSVARAARDDDGAVLGAVVTHVDVSALGLIAERSQEGVLITDEHSRVEWANRAFARICGHDLASIRGRRPADVLSGRATDMSAGRQLGADLKRGTGGIVELVNYHRDGAPYWVEIETQPLAMGVDGPPGQAVAIERDVTDQHQHDALQTARASALAAVGRGAPLDQTVTALIAGLEQGAVDLRFGVLRVAPDKANLRLLAAPSLPSGYVEAVGDVPIATDAGPLGAAARQGERVIVTDLRRERGAGTGGVADRAGLGACWAEPAYAPDGTVLGVFAAFAPSAREPGDRELDFLRRGCHLASCLLERNQFERALAARDRQVRELFDCVPIGLFRTDAETQQVVEANRALAELLGYPDTATLMAEIDAAEVYVDARQRVRLRDLAAQTGQVSEMDVQFVRRDGRRVETLVNMGVIHDAHGRVAYYDGAVQDMTGHRRADAARAESEAKFRHVFDNAGLGIAIETHEGRIVDVNPAFEAMLGYTKGELIGTHFADLTHPDDRNESLTELAKVRNGERSQYTLDKRYLAAGGDVRWARVTVSLIPSGWLTPPSLVVLLDDVTERKALERELRDARDAAERASQAKTAFMANMSHELRTPLNAIIGLSEIIKDRRLGANASQYFEYAEDICRSGRHLLDIINDMLDMTRLESGGYALNEEHVATEKILRECMRMVAPKADSAGIRLGSSVAAPDLLADRRAVRQVVLNLLTNAMKFTGAGGEVRLDAGRLDDGGLELAVTDSGPGIDEDDLSRVMRPFEKGGRDPMAGDQEGTGLGLAISRKFMDLHGGGLHLESMSGSGTRAVAVFPAARVIEGTPS